MKIDLSLIAEIGFLAALVAGVLILFGLGWALIVGGSVGLLGAQFYGIESTE